MSESDYYDQNGPNPDPRPTRTQFGYARDAVGLAQLMLDGYDGAAADFALELYKDPQSLPGVLQGLAGMISAALQVDPGMTNAEFFQLMHTHIDEAEATILGD